MDVEAVFDRLMEAGVSVWLDEDGKLLIDKDAPAELKDLVRAHKPAIIAVLKARAVMNRSGVHIVRLPLGGFALAKPPGPLPEEVAAAIETLGMGGMPVVFNDEGGRWLPYREWARQQVLDFSKPLCDPEDLALWRRRIEAEAQEKLKRRRRAA